MRVGFLITCMGDFGQKGYYNVQETGLAKELEHLVDEVKIFKLVDRGQKERTEQVEGCLHTSIRFIPARSIGSNGSVDVSLLDASLDALIYFSDTQLAVPGVYKWARRNHISFFPYIGVTKSHSTNHMKKLLVDFLFKRNLAVYRKCRCFVKTPAVEDGLRALGVRDLISAPVGLDLSLLKADFEQYAVDDLKQKYGYRPSDRVLLFIGRLIDEKQPLRMLDIFDRLVQEHADCRLLMVGTGELEPEVKRKAQNGKIAGKVQLIDRIPNNRIWELYRLADTFVNLNQQEIFGMSVLEAMYYGCKVVAWTAPGPDLIIENGVSGWLVNSDRQVKEKIEDDTVMDTAARRRVMDEFTWTRTAKKIVDALEYTG